MPELSDRCPPSHRATAFHRTLRLAVALLCGLLASAGRAAEDEPTDDNPKLPPWFREQATVVLTHSERAKTVATAKLAEARLAQDRVTEAYALLMLGHAARRQNDIPGALRESREALGLAEHQGDELLLYNACYGHALNLRASGDHATAIDFLLRSLRLAEARLSLQAQSTTAAALGASYHSLGDLKLAFDYTRRSLALAEQAGSPRAIAMYAHNLGSIAESQGDLAAARLHYSRSLTLKRAEGNRTELADLEQQIAMLDFAEGRPEAALAVLTPILAQRRTLRGKVKLTGTLRCLSEVLLKLGRVDAALAHIEEARGYADAIESPGLRAGVYRRLAAVQEARGDFAAALAATRREFAERETIAGEAARTRVAELQTGYDLVKKDETLARLARENELQAGAARARSAELAQSAAELRTKDAELARTRTSRLAFASVALTAAALLGAIVVVQRTRIRAERRILADTRAARDAAQTADALKGRLLGFASHDLKAPLATLSSATHLLEESAHSPAHVMSLAATMRAEASRMILLVHDFIDRAALDVGRLELRPAPLDLARVAAQITTDFRPRATQKNQTLVLEEPPLPLPLVAGESARLEQVVANLVSNAINYSPQHGAIHVVLGHDATGVWCEVRDSGPGIPLAEQAGLFQPFGRLSPRPTDGESSSGLGLYLAHELVRLHQGTLTVRSQPGAGSAFRLTLAALPPTPAPV